MSTDTDIQPHPIAPTAVRYIKLGPGNDWFPHARSHNTLEFGHAGLAHEVAALKDRAAILARHLELGHSPGKATDFTREVFEFYALDESSLWITFAEGSLWWAFAKEGVVETGAGPGHGERHRVLMTPWCNTDINGTVLSIANLSTRLTKVAAYRQTLCRVEAEAYLIRKINGVEEPLVAEAKLVQTAVIDVAERLVAQLHWRDFEVLCDLIFARSGWQRIAELGGLQKDTDLVLEQIASGERAFVQVKSEAGQQTLNDYIARFEADPSFDRMFFACHSPRTKLEISGSKPVHVWTGEKLARQAVAAGLLDWLVEKAG
jgi:hypothetical protein